MAWNPDNSQAQLGLAHLAFQRNQLVRMDTSIRRALEIDRTMDIMKKSAHMYFYRKLYLNAGALYARLHAAFPEHLTSSMKLALIRAHQRDYEGARSLAERVLATRPRTASASDGRNKAMATRLLADLIARQEKRGRK